VNVRISLRQVGLVLVFGVHFLLAPSLCRAGPLLALEFQPDAPTVKSAFKEFSCFLARASYSPISAFLTNSANRRSSGRRPGSWRRPRLAMAFHLRCPL
jgi:hypothetical protein